MNEVSSYFNRSGKRLTELCKELCIKLSKIVKSGKTRWLSRAGCVVAMVKVFPAVAAQLPSAVYLQYLLFRKRAHNGG